MSKGTILLLTDRTLEGTIIENFLRTKGYETQNISSSHTSSPTKAIHADVAILVLDDPRSNLTEACNDLRRLTQRPQLPMIAILPNALGETIVNVRVMVRPVRLFELADVVAQLINEQRHAKMVLQRGEMRNPQNSNDRHFNYVTRVME
jgi:DNA-binding response OmpR family regulator